MHQCLTLSGALAYRRTPDCLMTTNGSSRLAIMQGLDRIVNINAQDPPNLAADTKAFDIPKRVYDPEKTRQA